MRTDPTSLIPDLAKMAKAFDGKARMVKVDGVSTKLMTQEGDVPVLELIEFLKRQKALKPLTLAADLKPYACNHVKDQGPTGKVGHSASNGDDFASRIAKLTKPGKLIGENISYGSKEAKEAAIQLAIDDGVSERGHRANIFKENYTELGVCNGSHKDYKVMAVGIYRGKSSSQVDPKADPVV